MNEKVISSLSQLASEKGVTDLLCAVVGIYHHIPLTDAKSCIDSVNVDDKAVHVKAHLPDGSKIQLLIGILPDRKPSPYDLISKPELEKIFLDESLSHLCFVWVIPDPENPPEFKPITSDMITQFAKTGKNLVGMTSMCALLPTDEFWT